MKYAIACKNEPFYQLLNEYAPDVAKKALLLKNKEDLNQKTLRDNGINIIFFPHWSWFVDEDITKEYTCICFHSSPVPYGRGGSPVQNMVLRGHQATEIVALKMNTSVDSGPVYIRKNISLLGGGEEVYRRIYITVIELIKELINKLPKPVAQEGTVTSFKRRKKEESQLSFLELPELIFDKIRILDIDGYPPAYIDIGNYRLTFSHPVMRINGDVNAHVNISRIKNEK